MLQAFALHHLLDKVFRWLPQDLVQPVVLAQSGVLSLGGLNRNKLLAAKPALMFLGVNARSLAGLYREVKCSSPVALTPPRPNRST
jgi:hypothetical protein